MGGDVERCRDRRGCVGTCLTGLSRVRGTRCTGGRRGGHCHRHHRYRCLSGAAGSDESAPPALHPLLDGASPGPGRRQCNPAPHTIVRAGTVGYRVIPRARRLGGGSGEVVIFGNYSLQKGVVTVSHSGPEQLQFLWVYPPGILPRSLPRRRKWDAQTATTVSSAAVHWWWPGARKSRCKRFGRVPGFINRALKRET